MCARAGHTAHVAAHTGGARWRVMQAEETALKALSVPLTSSEWAEKMANCRSALKAQAAEAAALAAARQHRRQQQTRPKKGSSGRCAVS